MAYYLADQMEILLVCESDHQKVTHLEHKTVMPTALQSEFQMARSSAQSWEQMLEYSLEQQLGYCSVRMKDQKKEKTKDNQWDLHLVLHWEKAKAQSLVLHLELETERNLDI
jgi:hypothetical protein